MAQKVSRRLIAQVVAAKLAEQPKAADAKHVMRELAAFLMENKLLDDADVLMNDIAEELYRLTGRLVVEVTSAHPLEDAERTRLTDYLERATGAASIDLHEAVNPGLIGGLIAKTPSAELDVSVQSTLRQLTALA